MLNRVCTFEEFEALCTGLKAGHNSVIVRVSPQDTKVGSIHVVSTASPLKLGVLTALCDGDDTPHVDGDPPQRGAGVIFAIGTELARDLNGYALWHVRGRDVLAFTTPAVPL